MSVFNRAVLRPFFLILSFLPWSVSAQDTLRPSKWRTVAAIQAGTGAVGLLGLNELWYKDYPRSSFHFFNDLHEWEQMDKAGHFYSTYQLSRFSHAALVSAGQVNKKAVLTSSLLVQGYFLGIEVLDGFSGAWGFSPWDMAFNIAGTSLFAAQQMGWEKQKVSLSFSYHPTRYAAIRPGLLGKTHSERLFKDYNGQTYFLNFNLSSFFPSSQVIPSWLDLSVGYGAEGMTGGHANIVNCQQGICFQEERYRQFYFGPSIRLGRIKTKSAVLKTIFNTVDMVRLPFPLFEAGKKGVTFHWVYF